MMSIRSRLVNLFILWCLRRNKWSLRLRDSDDAIRTKRFCPFWYDEWTDKDGEKHNRPPWYRPFNILLHRWLESNQPTMHDHPRWSITIVLRGVMIEHTPWEKKVLTPGSIVIRSRKYIHTIEIPEGYKGKTWTLFIVGRRNHKQNYFEVIGFDREY